MEIIDVLKETKALLSDPSSWNKTYFAVDFKGRSVNTTDESACRWCLAGAIFHVADVSLDSTLDDKKLVCDTIDHIEKLDDITNIDQDALGHNEPIVYFNDKDDTTHENVIDILDKAIQSL